jgi:hypothetical protein
MFLFACSFLPFIDVDFSIKCETRTIDSRRGRGGSGIPGAASRPRSVHRTPPPMPTATI